MAITRALATATGASPEDGPGLRQTERGAWILSSPSRRSSGAGPRPTRRPDRLAPLLRPGHLAILLFLEGLPFRFQRGGLRFELLLAAAERFQLAVDLGHL